MIDGGGDLWELSFMAEHATQQDILNGELNNCKQGQKGKNIG